MGGVGLRQIEARERALERVWQRDWRRSEQRGLEEEYGKSERSERWVVRFWSLVLITDHLPLKASTWVISAFKEEMRCSECCR